MWVLSRAATPSTAAIAIAAALTVVEPTSNGIGSDAFAMLWADGALHGLNASGRGAPRERRRPAHGRPRRGARGRVDPRHRAGAVSAWGGAAAATGACRSRRSCSPRSSWRWRLPGEARSSPASGPGAAHVSGARRPGRARALVRHVRPGRPHAGGRRGRARPGPRPHAARDRGIGRPLLLRGLPRRAHRCVLPQHRRLAPWRGPRRPSPRMGGPDRHRLPRLRRVGDPPERPRHLRARRARHPRGLPRRCSARR